VALGLLGYGLAIEFAQAAIGWRFGDWQDWSADAFGVAVAYFGWTFLNPSRSHGKLPLVVDSMKMETSLSARRGDEEVEVHGEPDHGDFG
jgi:hypothetical protein